MNKHLEQTSINIDHEEEFDLDAISPEQIPFTSQTFSMGLDFDKNQCHGAFFDFDGTLTKKDSFFEFLFFCFGKPKVLFNLAKALVQIDGTCIDIIKNKKKHIYINPANTSAICTAKALSPMETQQALRVRSFIKAQLLYLLFKGQSCSFIQNKAIEFQPYLQSIIFEPATSYLEQLKNNGVFTFLVSASLELYLQPIAKKLKFDAFSGTRLEEKDGCFTGYILGFNCIGSQKCARIKHYFDNYLPFEQIWCYGDSMGDDELLKLATPNYAFYKPFSSINKDNLHKLPIK